MWKRCWGWEIDTGLLVLMASVSIILSSLLGNTNAIRMSQTVVSYEEMGQKIAEELKKHSFMVLATSEKDIVTARSMLCVSEGVTVYCTTPPKGIKYKQIRANPNVALASGNVQIQGVIKLRGNPADEGNTVFIETIRKTKPEFYDVLYQRYRDRPDYLLLEIIPRRISVYHGAALEGVPETYLDVLNVEKKEAYRIRSADREKSSAYWK